MDVIILTKHVQKMIWFSLFLISSLITQYVAISTLLLLLKEMFVSEYIYLILFFQLFS